MSSSKIVPYNLTCEHTIEIVVSIPPTLTLFDNTNPNMSDY